MSWHVAVGARVGALELDIELEGGARPVVLVGPNGSGKTTLLRIIAGAHRPARGRITVGQRTLFDSDAAIDLPPEQRRVGYVPQGYGLFPQLSAGDNVAFGLRHARREASSAERQRLVSEMLERLECPQLAERMPHTLSGGEQQRIALARALIVDPELMVLDEPLAALDAGSRRRMRKFLVDRLTARGRPAIVVTHDLRDVAALASEVFVLEHGRIVQRGTVAQLQESPATEFVAELLDVPTVRSA